MKITKRLGALLLVLAMTVSLAACGGSESPAPAETPAPTAEASAVETPAPAEEPAEAPAEESVEEPAEAPVEESVEEPAEEPVEETVETTAEDVGFSRGVVNSNTYYSEVLGMGCELSDEWTIANEEQLAMISGLTNERISDADLTDMIEDGGAVMDFYAENIYGDTMNIQVQKLDLVTTISSAMTSDEDLVKEIYDQYGDIADQMYAAIGLSNGSIEMGTIKFNGKDTPCIRITGVMNLVDGSTVDFFEVQVIHRSLGYVGILTSSAMEIDTNEEALAGFYLD